MASQNAWQLSSPKTSALGCSLVHRGVTNHKTQEKQRETCVLHVAFFTLSFTIHPESHESSVASSCTKGTRGLQGAALSAVQLEMRSLGKGGWCQSQQGRGFWLPCQGVRCPQWRSDGLWHLRTNQLCAGPGGKYRVHSLSQWCLQAEGLDSTCQKSECWLYFTWMECIYLLQSCIRIFFSDSVVWITRWVSSSVIHTCWCQINFYLSTAEGRWGPFAGLGDGGNAHLQLAPEIKLLNGFLAFKLNV